MILILKVFLRLLNSFEIIFRQETSIICTTARSHRSEFQVLFFTFYWQKCFCLECWRSKVLPFHCKSTEWAWSSVVCSLEVGIEAIQWKILFVWEFFLLGTFWFMLVCYSMSTCMISMSSITLDWNKGLIGMLTTLKENFASTRLFN